MSESGAPRTAHGWARTFAGVVTTLFCGFTAIGLVITVIPRLVTGPLDGSAFEVGAAFTVSGVVALLVRPQAGRAAQRRGCRVVMALGAALLLLAAALYAAPFGFAGLLMARFVVGVAEAMLFTAGSVWTVSLTPPDRRGQIVGLYGLAMWSGLAVGPVAGEAVFRAGSYPAVWGVAAALPLIALAVLSRLPSDAPSGAAVSARLLPPSAVLPGLSLGCGAFGYAAVAGFGALAMADRGIAGGSLLISFFSAAYVTGRLVAGRMPDRVGPLPVIVVSASLEATGLIVIAFSSALAPAAAGALIAGAGFTLLYPALALITIDSAPESERGAALGAVSSFFDLSVGVAGLAGGLLAETSFTATFLMAGAIVLGSLPTGLAATRGGHRARTPAPAG